MAFVPKSTSPHEEEAVETDHDAPNPRQLDGFPAAAAAPIAFRTRGSELRLRSSSDNMVEEEANAKIVEGDFGYVLEDVPHLVDYLPDIPTYPNPLQDNAAYSVVKQYFVNVDDTVPYKIVVQKNSPRGVHFRRAGPRQRVYFKSDDVLACIVTCGGLCPGLNTVIRELVCGLSHMYNVKQILGIEGGYRGFYARNTIPLIPKTVNDIHKRGGTILGTSRGGHDTIKIVDNIEDRGINQEDDLLGTSPGLHHWWRWNSKGALEIFKEIRRRGLKVAVAGIPKTIDNDIAVIDKSFGFDTAVEEAQRAINAAHVESESVENGIGLVKLMGRYSGFIAMYATLASRDVDCCLIPESPFYLEGPGGLFEYIEKRLKENGHMVIVVAEGAGQKLIAESMQSMDHEDASGNKLLLDVGLWLSHKIKAYFSRKQKMVINLKYIDPTYMIRAIPSIASDNVYCTLLAHSAIHGAMAGYTGFTVGLVNGRHTYIPFHRVTQTRNKVVITDRMWARLLSSTNQPSFLSAKDIEPKEPEKPLEGSTAKGNRDGETTLPNVQSGNPTIKRSSVVFIVGGSNAIQVLPDVHEDTPASATSIDTTFDSDRPPQDSESDSQSDGPQKDSRKLYVEEEKSDVDTASSSSRFRSLRSFTKYVRAKGWNAPRSTVPTRRSRSLLGDELAHAHGHGREGDERKDRGKETTRPHWK
uniref:ATP-dependent 6-phosphofructokinase n=1 Tax=Ananas comosus var. bracteatus TaxID=296719 RepID=A0A6V7P004_ANACO|nr:unnamed protein product [Ananas comosus var. bracteatus]